MRLDISRITRGEPSENRVSRISGLASGRFHKIDAISDVKTPSLGVCESGQGGGQEGGRTGGGERSDGGGRAILKSEVRSDTGACIPGARAYGQYTG